MTQEEYVKMLIVSSGHNVKSFAESIELPYTTLLGMLSRGLGGASVDNVIRVCKGLGISVEDLQNVEDASAMKIPFYVSGHEKKVISAYRAKANLQQAVDILLGVEVDETTQNDTHTASNLVPVRYAAFGGNGAVETMTPKAKKEEASRIAREIIRKKGK